MLGYSAEDIQNLIDRLYSAQKQLGQIKHRNSNEAVQDAIDILDGLLIEGHF